MMFKLTADQSCRSVPSERRVNTFDADLKTLQAPLINVTNIIHCLKSTSQRFRDELIYNALDNFSCLSQEVSIL